MVCHSCVEKLALQLVANHRRNLDLIRALELAEKGVERVQRRHKLQQDRLKFYEISKRLLGVNLKALLFRTNWKATLFWRRWIGKGHNPDYTQNCVSSGTCSCRTAGFFCLNDDQCRIAGTCACACPAPLPNSSLVNNLCTVTRTHTCTCDVTYNLCDPPGTCTCGCTPPAGCQYNCDPGYAWNGVACVLAPARRMLGDSFYWIQIAELPFQKPLKLDLICA